MKTVYLAGPITGLTYGGCTEWRDGAIESLALFGIEGLSPMRGKEALSHLVDPLSGTAVEYAHLTPLATPKGILTRDHWDCNRADAIIFNLLGATKPSQGTIMEIAWGYHRGIPLIAAIEESGNPHEHAMVTGALTYRFTTLEEAIAAVIVTLNGQYRG